MTAFEIECAETTGREEGGGVGREDVEFCTRKSALRACGGGGRDIKCMWCSEKGGR